jgi:hypothetical protein
MEIDDTTRIRKYRGPNLECDRSRVVILRSFISTGTLLLLLAASAQPGRSQSNPDLQTFFRQNIGLSQDQISSIRNGQSVTKILPSPTPAEVVVFGAVFIKAAPEKYLAMASDVDALRKLPNFLAIRKFSDPPRLSDLDGFTLEADDIKQLKACKPGNCEIQLPQNAIEEFQHSVDWSSPNAAAQANHLAQQMALQALSEYQQGGNAALGVYRDKSDPTKVADTFRSLVNQSKALPVYLPELDHYLLDYPSAKSNDIESQFYWEKVKFGLKPTLRIVQAIAYRGGSSSGPALAVAVKQLYASHYFETALDLTVCVRDTQDQGRDGFYLITLKGSQQAGLTGLKGGVVRKVAVDKTRSSLEQGLTSIKEQLER